MSEPKPLADYLDSIPTISQLKDGDFLNIGRTLI